MQEIKGMHASSKEHSEEAKALESRFSRCRTISGTQKTTLYETCVKGHNMVVRSFSFSTTVQCEEVTKSHKSACTSLSGATSEPAPY